MNSLQSPGNPTVVSIFQLIFIQQNYRAVHFYANNSQNVILHEMIRIASDSLKPVTHMEIDAITRNRSAEDEPILNVLLVGELEDVKKQLMESCLHGTTAIWSSTSRIDDLSSYTVIPWWLKISSKVIVLANSDLFTLNNLVETRASKLSLTNVSVPSINHFLKSFFSIESVRGSRLTIFTQFNPPKSDLAQIDRNYCVIGPDGVIAESFVKWLNVQPTFSSSIGSKFPNYNQWLNSSISLLRQRYQYYHSAVLTKNVVTIFNHNFNSMFDLQLTAFPHESRLLTGKIIETTKALFPHETDCLRAIVPHQDRSNDLLRNVLMNANTIGIGFALLLFILWRLFLQKGIRRRIFDVFFQTIVVFLNQSQIPNDNRMKVAWDINLRSFSVVATTTLSAIIFRNLIALNSIDINTVNDLVESNLTIYAPEYLQKHAIWPYISPSLRSKIQFQPANDIERYFMGEQEFNSAYVYSGLKAKYLTMIANYNVPIGSRRRVRLMKEKIHCTLVTYRISKNSPLTPHANRFILNVMENGLYDKQSKWIDDLYEAVFASERDQLPKRDNIVLTMKMTSDIFLVYLMGIGMAVICFFMEILILRIRLILS